jgi:hypothetical protein
MSREAQLQAAAGSWRSVTSNLPTNVSLEELDDGEKFDQFKGKKSTYKEELYTTKID